MNNLWILTEERPKANVITAIFERFAKEKKIGFFAGAIRIIPLLSEGNFSFTYQVLGINTPTIEKILIKTISGSSSFVDYLVYFQEHEPVPTDQPLFAIEETKTDDSESRNTGVYQRCTKFVYIDMFYQNVKKIMLYSLQVDESVSPSATNIFGNRLLSTYGVEILGKVDNPTVKLPFTSINELIDAKNSMRRPPAGNIPILIQDEDDEIQISGRLYKAGTLSHDPNIGALSIISAVIRKLGCNKKITITQHGLSQKNIPLRRQNKFIQICNKLNINLQGLSIPKYQPNKNEYWHFEKSGEKLGTIFIHLVVEAFTKGYSIFENHAGCEKSYFVKSDGTFIPLKKYTDRGLYKSGDKTAIIHIPDLILVDIDKLEIINIEGKIYNNREVGIRELENYNFIEQNYITPSYPEYKIIRTVVLYGGTKENNDELNIEIGFLLNDKGKMILGIKAPSLFKVALRNLLDYWKCNNDS
ncbi:hypothetical protein [Bartonella sp. HY761]|uniref:hypothetical protein n=1 Tax=Bartonella sp. HY761 TaxID=2979330 RepID=UPI0021E3340B|nr:hypothetical protein [Bartonella sp. HY761]UXN08168.1 hypothetical protein N6A79_15820 [Bartonella sp. HY761]